MTLHALTSHHREHLKKIGIPEPPEQLDIHPSEYNEHYANWKRTLPLASHDELHNKVLAHHAWKKHSEPKEVLTEIQTPRLELRWIAAILGLIALLLMFQPKAHAQFSKISSIDVRNNDNSAATFIASPFTFKAGANCSWSVSGTTITFNCSAASGGAGGSSSQVQWNSTGSLAGISTFTTDGTVNTAKVGTNWFFVDPSDTSKKIQFDASGLTASTTRTIAFPDANSRTIKNGSTTGQIPIWNNVTSTFDVSDPLVQGTTAEGAAIPNPVVMGGKDGSGNNKALILDSSGRPTVNVNGTVAVSAASLPLPSGAAADSSLTTIDTDLKANIVLAAGAHVIGHTINDTGSTTAVTGNVAVTIADAADTTLGAKADAKSSATDTTAITIMQVMKEISAMEQAPASRAVTNAGTFAVQATLQANSGVDIGKLTANQSVNVAQIAGQTTTTTDNGTQAVAPIVTTSSTAATSACNILSAASTNSTSCKGSASNFYGYEIYNTTTTIYYLRLYNTASAPTCSSATGFIRTIPIQPAGAAGGAGGSISNQVFPVNYGTGIGFCLTGGSSSTDNTNAAVGIFGEIRYK